MTKSPLIEAYLGFVLGINPVELVRAGRNEEDEEYYFSHNGDKITVDPANVTVEGDNPSISFARGYNSEAYYFWIGRANRRVGFADYSRNARIILRGKIARRKLKNRFIKR